MKRITIFKDYNPVTHLIDRYGNAKYAAVPLMATRWLLPTDFDGDDQARVAGFWNEREYQQRLAGTFAGG